MQPSTIYLKVYQNSSVSIISLVWLESNKGKIDVSKLNNHHNS